MNQVIAPTVQVNGEARRLDPDTDLASVVEEYTARRHGVAVAVNGAVVPRGRWAQTRLNDGDSLEIVTAVQGG